MRNIIKPEIVFCNKYILIIYLKTEFIKAKKEYANLDNNFLEDKVLKVKKNLAILYL